MSLSIRLRRLACAAAIAVVATGAARAADAPAYQIADPEPDITARTLEIVRTAEAPPARIWVYFTDKNVFDSQAAAARLADVRATLDPKAAARRARVIGASLVDFHDIPVHTGYVVELEAQGASVRHESRWLNAVSVVAPLEVLERIAALPFVQKLAPVAGAARVYPTRLLRTRRAAPGIGTEARGTGLDYGASEGQLQEINVVAAHDMGRSGAGVRIATLDTGFQHSHATFQDLVADGRLIAQWDFVNDDGDTENEVGDDGNAHNHGTATWSAMGGYTPGELIGPAYGAEFLLAKTEDVTSETPVEEDNWCAAAEWADLNGADIITSSLSYLDWYTYPDMDGQTAAITLCADLAVSRGIVVCTSAGNEGSTSWHYVAAPADAFHVLAVGAVTSTNDVAGFSSRGPTFDGRTKPEVVARGVSTHCALPGGIYTELSGTSLSCPLVAGAAALVLEENPTWTPAQVRLALMQTADNAGAPDNDRGWGRIDVVAAMAAVVATNDAPAGTSPAPVVPRLLAAPNPLSTGTTLSFALGEADRGAIEIFEISGRQVAAFSADRSTGVWRWDGRDGAGRRVAPGVYVARLSSGAWRSSVKLVVER